MRGLFITKVICYIIELTGQPHKGISHGTVQIYAVKELKLSLNLSVLIIFYTYYYTP